MFTTHTKKRRWLATLLVLAMMIGMLPASATTAYATDTPTLQIPDTVKVEKMSPEGITINLFDYWLDAQGNRDDSNPADYENIGINEKHTLKFGKGMGQVGSQEATNSDQNQAEIQEALAAGNINFWTNGARPMAGIVASTLGNDGYPVLKANSNSESASLGYLFNTSSGDSKAAYLDVGGLLQQDSEGVFLLQQPGEFRCI